MAWVAPCLTGSSKRGLPASFRGHLVAWPAQPAKLGFVGRRGWRKLARTVDLAGCQISRASRFLSEDLIIQNPAKNSRQVFVFDRSKAALVKRIVELLGAGTPERETQPSGGLSPAPARA